MAHMPNNAVLDKANLFPDLVEAMEKRYNGRPISTWVVQIWKKLENYCVEEGNGKVFEALDAVIALKQDNDIWTGEKLINYKEKYDNIWNILSSDGTDPALDDAALNGRVKNQIKRIKKSGWRHRDENGIWKYFKPIEAWNKPLTTIPGGLIDKVRRLWSPGFLNSQQYKDWKNNWPTIDLSKPSTRPLFMDNPQKKKGPANENKPSFRRGPANENTMATGNVHHAITGRRMGITHNNNNNGNFASGQGGKARYGKYGDDLFFDEYDGYDAYDGSVDGYNPGLDRYYASVQNNDFISDKYYHQYGSYNHYHSDYILLVAIGGFIFIAMCCFISMMSIIGGFVSGKFYEMKKNEKSHSNRHKYDVGHLNDDQV